MSDLAKYLMMRTAELFVRFVRCALDITRLQIAYANQSETLN